MTRVAILPLENKTRGLWVAGPPEKTPSTHLRRARATHAIAERSVRSRDGSSIDTTIAVAHSLHRFDDVRFQGATGVLYRAGVSIDTGYDGTPLSFQVSEPRAGTDAEYLFVAGGGKVTKVDTAGTVTQWGIDAPTGGNWGTEVNTNEDDSETTVGDPQFDTLIPTTTLTNWTGSSAGPFTGPVLVSADVPSGTGVRIDGQPFVEEGPTSFTVATQIALIYTFPSPADFTTYAAGDTSPNQDFIALFIQTDSPQLYETINVRFSSTTTFNDSYVFVVRPATAAGSSQRPLGLADIPIIDNNQEGVVDGTDFRGEQAQTDAISTLADATTFYNSRTWQLLKIPKASFIRFGNPDWASIRRFVIEAVPSQSLAPVPHSIAVGDIGIRGGGRDNSGGSTTESNGGLQGTYRYKITFRNSTTGNRSNPTPTAQVARDVDRGFVTLSNIPVSTDPQVDQREIWRTLGGGTRFFLADRIEDNTTTSYVDQVADYAGLDDSGSDIQILGSEELPLDNDPPFDSFDDAIIVNLTAFWIDNTVGRQGRVYFSPIGRPESLKGFINVSQAGDPLHRLVVLNGQRYVFSESRVYRVDGDDPYVSREIGGVPGVQFAQRRTITATPFGIVWQATDGIRLFTGSSSQLLGFDPLGRIFRGEAAEDLTAFEGTTATYARGDYHISNGFQSMALNIADGTWRELGYDDISVYYYEWDTDTIQAGRTANVQLIEVENTTTDSGAAINFEMQTPAVDAPNDQIVVVERTFIDLDAASQTVTGLLVHRLGTISLTSMSNATRRTEGESLEVMTLKPAIRLSSAATARVEVFDIELEVRNLQLGLNVQGQERQVQPGRYDEAAGRIVWDIMPETKVLDQTDFLFVIDRLTVEANTDSNSVTPRVLLGNTEVALTAISSSARGVTEFEIDRIGPLNQVSLAGDFFATTPGIQIYRVEVHLRPLVLGVKTRNGQRVIINGRSPDPSSTIIFEVDPALRALDGQAFVPIYETISIDMDPDGETYTPVMHVGHTDTVTLQTITGSARAPFEYEIDMALNLREFRINGDFTNGGRIFGVEMLARPFQLGINVNTEEN